MKAHVSTDIVGLPLKLDVYLPDFRGGGAEKASLMLIREFLSMGVAVRVIVHRISGELSRELPKHAQVISLEAGRTLLCLRKLASHLRSDPPDILLSNLVHNNIAVLWARMLARLLGKCKTRVIICQHNALSEEVRYMATWQFRVLPKLYRWFGGFSEAVVGVSDGVCDDLAAVTGLDRASMVTLHNPVIDDAVSACIHQSAPTRKLGRDSPWTVLGMGRLVFQKDFETLLRAFALIEDEHANLVIAGTGPDLDSLKRLAENLSIAGRVAWVGFVENPLHLLQNAEVFVLSSRYEGLGNVLVEALACGVPVVSTRCPHGPAEILRDGTVGLLVPVGDCVALAAAITRQRKAPFPDVAVRTRRAADFHVRLIAQKYMKLFSVVMERPFKS